ncbi:MAG: carbohydrate binding family 9 domain-containing protein [Acidobacteria bacterium]|nr:carbohydrate binding family 9 domain-containing protein [Acidobacteriota bacterium]
MACVENLRLGASSGWAIGLTLAGALWVAVPPAAGQERAAPQRFQAARATSPVSVDGVLDEAAWRDAVVIPLQYEWQPGDNTPPVERTEALVTHDGDNLYVAFRAFDRDPAAIRAHLADRDSPYLDDTVGFLLDTFNDQRRAYQFRVNPLGVQMDAINSDVDGSEDWSWDAIWEAAGHVTPEGYIVEVALPFSSIRFPRHSQEQTWGFVAMRDLPRSVRRRMRSAYTARDRSCTICQLDKLTGIQGVKPGLNLELDPTFTLARTDRRAAFPSGRMEFGPTDPQAGLTARWSVTPNVTLGTMVNPDFYQVEADAAQLEINTRFQLFYPEKRPFFLESADFFATPIRALFTRTVVDPSWGGKVTGKESGSAFGVFLARDEVTNIVFPAYESSSFGSFAQGYTSTVVRYRGDVGRTSTIGGIYVGREGHEYFNRAAGVDGQLRFTNADSIRFQLLGSSTTYPAAVAGAYGQPHGAFAGGAYFLAYNHSTRNWSWWARQGGLSPEFRVDGGFEPRAGVRTGAAGIHRTIWSRPQQWFSRFELSLISNYITDFASEREEWGADANISYYGPMQSRLTFIVAPNSEYYDGRTYNNNRRRAIWFELRPTGNFAVLADARAGNVIDVVNSRQAEMREVRPRIEFALARRINGTIAHQYHRLDVKGGGHLFTANLTQANLLYHFNVRTFVRAILQHTRIDRSTTAYLVPVESKTRRLFSQYLFSYKLNPQTVLLVGYSDNALGTRSVDLTQTDRTFFLKIGYAWLM